MRLGLGLSITGQLRSGETSLELLTNADFSSGTTGWSVSFGTIRSDDNQSLTMIEDSDGLKVRTYQVVDVEVGKRYFFQTRTGTGGGGGTGADGLTMTVSDSVSFGGKRNYEIIGSDQGGRLDFIAKQSQVYTLIYPTITKTNLQETHIARPTSFQENSDPELIVNGLFASDLTGWTTGAGVGSTWSASGVLIERNSQPFADQFYQDVTCVIGEEYALLVDVVSLSNNLSVMTEGTENLFDTTGEKIVRFTAASTNVRISINPSGSATATATVTDVSLRLDRLSEVI